MRNLTLLLPVCLLLADSQSIFAANGLPSDKQVEVRWSKLGELVADGDIKLVLPSGTLVEGRPVAFLQDELVLDVSKSSNKQDYPKGRRSIPRASITTIHLTQTKGAKGRIIGTIAGFFGGAGLGTAIALSNDDADVGPRAGVAALWIGTTAAGYYAGRSMDRKTMLIKVLPD